MRKQMRVGIIAFFIRSMLITLTTLLVEKAGGKG